jgi:hypothetical protein
MQVTLDDLASFVCGLSPTDRDALADEGMFLSVPPQSSGYKATPSDYLMFASTGVDGVHFSMINGSCGDTPVFMTVPMNFESPNLVVGAYLHEFLCLGCISGYSMLDGLVYSQEETALALEKAKEPKPIMKRLAREFALRPWQNTLGRLAELNR